MAIDIVKFLEVFNREYDFLYDNDDNVAGYEEAVDSFDEFVNFRGDFVSSDREAAAFMFALDIMT